MNIKALYTLFKRSRITKKILIGAIYEYIGSKNGLRTVAWKNGMTHQALYAQILLNKIRFCIGSMEEWDDTPSIMVLGKEV